MAALGVTLLGFTFSDTLALVVGIVFLVIVGVVVFFMTQRRS